MELLYNEGTGDGTSPRHHRLSGESLVLGTDMSFGASGPWSPVETRTGSHHGSWLSYRTWYRPGSVISTG